MTSKKETPEEEKQPVTDPKVEAVQPATTEYHPELDIAEFAHTLQTLVDHADKQAQVQSEYQSRWQWWRTRLQEFHREVKQHVKE